MNVVVKIFVLPIVIVLWVIGWVCHVVGKRKEVLTIAEKDDVKASLKEIKEGRSKKFKSVDDFLKELTEVKIMKKNKINPQRLLSELDMALSEDYGCGLDLEKYPSIGQLIEVYKELKEAKNCEGFMVLISDFLRIED